MTHSTTTPVLIERAHSLWVFCKPSGWAVHPTNDSSIEDVLTWSQNAIRAPKVLAPTHRIDRDTSGVVIFSSDKRVRAQIGRWFAEGQVKKTYYALVYGEIEDSGTISMPIADARRKKKLDAITHYTLVESLGNFSLLEVHPQTGRKHQIRRHLHGIGHPLVGDTRYRSKKYSKLPACAGRLWLHAYEITLPDGRHYRCDLPPELEDHLAMLRSMSKR